MYVDRFMCMYRQRDINKKKFSSSESFLFSAFYFGFIIDGLSLDQSLSSWKHIFIIYQYLKKNHQKYCKTSHAYYMTLTQNTKDQMLLIMQQQNIHSVKLVKFLLGQNSRFWYTMLFVLTFRDCFLQNFTEMRFFTA